MTSSPPRWFEDYPTGSAYELGEVTPSEEQIVAFAREFDPQPFHVDAAAAARSPFGGIIASGWHTAAMMMRLVVDGFLSPESSLGSPGLTDLRFPAPVRPGRALRLRAEVLDGRVSVSRPDRGILHTRFAFRDEDDTEVFSVVATNLIRTRPASG